MIVALLNQMGGVGKTTLALHLAGAWAGQGKRVTVIDADPQGSALDWSAQRAKEAVPRLFGVVGLARDTLHREAPELARDADYVVIDGPPRVAGLLRRAHRDRPRDRSGPCRSISAGPPLPRRPARRLRGRRAYRAARLRPRYRAPRSARDRRLGGRSRSGDAMSARPSNRGFASRPGDPKSWVRTREPSAAAQSAGDLFNARLTIDVTSALRARIKITAFQRGQTVADMLRDLLAREFPAADGGQT